MITNHLLLKLKTRDAEAIKKAQNLLMSIKGKIDHLKDISIEVDIGHMQSRYDMQAIEQFESLEDLKAFLVNPCPFGSSKIYSE